jgi:hypothetical protein
MEKALLKQVFRSYLSSWKELETIEGATMSALVEKFSNSCDEVVCNLHYINEPLVAYISFN